MKNFTKLTIISVAVLSTAACASLEGNIDPDFGAAITAAYDKQIVSTQAETGAPVTDPRVQGAAYQRYLNDQVKQPKNSGAATTSDGEE